MENYKLVQVRVEPETHRIFKIMCAESEVSMDKVLNGVITAMTRNYLDIKVNGNGNGTKDK